MRRLIQTHLPETHLERVRQDHAAAIGELQGLPFVGARVIANVTLADGVATPVAHGLGRPAVWVRESAPRNPISTGRVEEIRTGSHDRSKFAVLKATGWGGPIIVDVVCA